MDKLFQTHVLNEQGMEKAKKLGALFDTLLADIKALNPVDGRELAVCKTKLEEACFFAKKALASHVENQSAP